MINKTDIKDIAENIAVVILTIIGIALVIIKDIVLLALLVAGAYFIIILLSSII